MTKEMLVMLPGMMCDARLFAPQIAAFKESHEIMVPPLMGYTSIDHFAHKVLAETHARRFNLMGLSMGGIVAMAMLRLAPGRITRLALLDTNHLADAPERFAIRNKQIADAKTGKLRQVIAEEMKPAYLARTNRHNQALLDLLIDMALSLGPLVFAEQSLALRDRADHTDALRNYKGLTLILCGAEDSLCPPERHQQMAQLCANAELKIIVGAGHISTLEQPEAVNQSLRQWLARPVEEDSHA